MKRLLPSTVLEFVIVLTVAAVRIVGLLTDGLIPDGPEPLGLEEEHAHDVAGAVAVLALGAAGIALVTPRTHGATVVKVSALVVFVAVMLFTEFALIVLLVTLYVGALILLTPIGATAGFLLFAAGLTVLAMWSGRRPIGPLDPVASRRRAWEPDPAPSWPPASSAR